MKNLLKLISKFALLISFLILFPIITFAQFVGPCPEGTYNNGTACVPISSVGSLISGIQQLLNSIVPVLIVLGVVYFVWGVVQYVIAGGEEVKTKGRDKMIYGIIGLAVIIGLWGLVNIVVNTFNLNASAPSLASLTGAAAGSCDALTGIGKLICQTQQIINSVIPVLMALGVVYFVWGVVQYVIADSEEAKKTGRNRIIYGIIGFAVIVGLWGLVNIIVNTLGLGGASTYPVPPSGTCSALTTGATFKNLLDYITCIIANSVIPLLFAGAAIMFIWGVVKFFIIDADEEAKRAQGRQFMIWGIIALAVMLSVWGLAGILGSTFGINTSVLPTVHPPGAGQ